MADRKGKPEPLAAALHSFLHESGLDERLGRMSVLTEWAVLVGPQIAQVTTANRVTQDGTLFVTVATHAWMAELSLMEVQLLGRINRLGEAPRVRKIRWELRR